MTGIGGTGVGLEILKALHHAGDYRLVGADMNELSYGLYSGLLDASYVVPGAKDPRYTSTLLRICRSEGARAFAPGSDAEITVTSRNRETFEQAEVIPMINSSRVLDLCMDKEKTFAFLGKKRVPVPKTLAVTGELHAKDFRTFPCIVKPKVGGGGSNFVFLAETFGEAAFFAGYLRRRGIQPLLQEYIGSPEGEYTVGVLSSPDGKIIGSIALKRLFHSRLSYLIKSGEYLVSSGHSQGLINDYVSVRKQAERISQIIGSRWALNIQGRLVEGTFIPFEINPRHSGTTYLRALAGFNEPHILIQQVLFGKTLKRGRLKKGYYLRSLSELYLPPGRVKNDKVDH